MDISLSVPALVGIALATMFFGYFFGLFEGRGQGYKRRKKEEENDPVFRAALEKSLPTASSVPAHKTGPAAELELLSVRQDVNGKTQLDLNGERLNAAGLSPQQRKRLIELMVLMRPWVEGRAAPEQTPVPASTQRPPVSLSDRLRAATGPERPVTQPTPASTAVAPPAPASLPTSIVAQIDAVLQGRLVGTPLADLGIRLVESLGGGVTVLVGNDHYAGVAEVPNPEVQAAIRAAIAEWETKYTPG
jgi:hypothetical protein